MNVAFAGFRHSHIFDLYKMINVHDAFSVLGGFEADDIARQVAIDKGIPCSYQSYEALLSDDRVETVILGGCYADRGAMAIQALHAGKHVIADKPLCTSLEELDEIERLSKEKKKVVSCMFTMRFEPKITAVRDLIQSGVLGEINNVYFGGQHPLMYGRRPMWYFEEGKHGGVINDIAIHGIDLLPFMLDLWPEHINAARCWNKFATEEPQFKDSAQFMLTAKNGAGILADVSYAVPDGVEFALPYYWQFYIWGTEGTLRFSLGEEDMFYYKKGVKEPIVLEPLPPKTDYLSDFLNAIQQKEDVILPMQDVFDSTRMTLLIQKRADYNRHRKEDYFHDAFL